MKIVQTCAGNICSEGQKQMTKNFIKGQVLTWKATNKKAIHQYETFFTKLHNQEKITEAMLVVAIKRLKKLAKDIA